MTFLLQRIAYAALTVLGVLTISFFLLRAAPGDPITLMLLADEASEVSAGVREELMRRYGLDLPVHIQYTHYLGRLARGDFGRTIRGNQPVLEEIRKNLPATVALALAGIAFAIVGGILAGIMSALNRDSWADLPITGITLFLYSAPNFWFGILMIYVFSYRLGWFPILDSRESALLEQLRLLVMPAVVIGSHSAAAVARMTRSTVLEVLGLDYIRTAHAKGVAWHAVLGKHALRNAAIPVVTLVGLSFAHLLGGSVVIEVVFARRGLGRVVVDAIHGREYAQVQGSIIVMVLIVVIVNLFVDMLYVLLDPRIRYD